MRNNPDGAVSAPASGAGGRSRTGTPRPTEAIPPQILTKILTPPRAAPHGRAEPQRAATGLRARPGGSHSQGHPLCGSCGAGARYARDPGDARPVTGRGGSGHGRLRAGGSPPPPAAAFRPGLSRAGNRPQARRKRSRPAAGSHGNGSSRGPGGQACAPGPGVRPRAGREARARKAESTWVTV